MTPSLQISVGQCSRAGRKAVNDDCVGVHIPDTESLLMKGVAAVIADGVSAATCGKEAAEMCVQSFILDYYSTPDTWSVKKSCEKVINSLNRWLYGQSHSLGYNAEKGYVSTLSSLVIVSNVAYLFHIGDTRIYRIRDGVVELLTRDHNSRVSSQTTYLNRAMGLNLSAKVDCHEVPVDEGDVFLFTSDGVHEWVDAAEIVSLLTGGNLDECAERLVEKAFAKGSDDNLTALVIQVDGLPMASHEELQKFLMERPFPPLLYPGQSIDGLEVEEILYESSRSQLYRVKDPKTGEVYVMKTPSLNYSDDPAYIERFVTEEWIGKRVTHQHLIRVLERSQKPRFLYYLMEEVKGESLADLARRKKTALSPSEVVPLVKQIVAGVRSLHRKDTLHQDLKLDNVMVTDEGVVKVIDYGSSRVASIQLRDAAHERQDALGTLDFSAPEYRFEGGKASVTSDQFSIAMIAYKLLTQGKCPYGDKWQRASSLSDFTGLEYVPAFKHSPLVPYWLDGALQKALSVRADGRYESMSEFVKDLETPNEKYVDSRQLPLMERDPLLFWKCLCSGLGVVIAILLVLLARK